MPIYQYKSEKKGCKTCTSGLEIMQSMKDKPLQKCPQCGTKVKKIPSRVSGFVPLLSNSSLRDKGFTKLVKRDTGTYEKVT